VSGSDDLPKRRIGYKVTTIMLHVTAGERLSEQIVEAIKLPEPPTPSLNEQQLNALLTQLANLATQALGVLQHFESDSARKKYDQPQYERVEIRVLSGGRLIGRVDGARRTFNERGKMTSGGVVAHINANPPRRKRRRGKQ
jgi:hypothetical protein